MKYVTIPIRREEKEAKKMQELLRLVVFIAVMGLGIKLIQQSVISYAEETPQYIQFQ